MVVAAPGEPAEDEGAAGAGAGVPGGAPAAHRARQGRRHREATRPRG